jgi:hypothetical protein
MGIPHRLEDVIEAHELAASDKSVTHGARRSYDVQGIADVLLEMSPD